MTKNSSYPWMLRITTSSGTTTGSGFVVAPQGLVVTCAHVVNHALGRPSETAKGPAEAVTVHFLHGGERVRASVIAWSPMKERDVAVLRLDGELPEGVTPLFLGSAALAKDKTLHTFGFPDANPVEGLAAQCEVVGETSFSGFPVLQVCSSEVTQGFSGAPAWDETLRVALGMVTRITAPDRQGRLSETTLLIPTESIRAICPDLRLPVGKPYRALDFFAEEHAPLYFGRERETRELLQKLAEHPAVLLIGVSGSGKSSLVRAGLKKALDAFPVPGMVSRKRVVVLPGSAPLLNLVLALAENLGMEAVSEAFSLPLEVLADETRRPQIADMLRARAPRRLAKSLQACAPSEELLLIFDQFERLYTDCTDDKTQRHFLDAVLAAAGDRVRLLFALRADYYAPALGHPGLGRVVHAGQVTLGPMSEDGLRAAIESPARALGRAFEPGLVERLIADVQGQAGNLPLLQFALAELWNLDNQQGILTQERYNALGYQDADGTKYPGVQGAIARRAEKLWKMLTESERGLTQQIFVSLLSGKSSAEPRDTRDVGRRAWKVELGSDARAVIEKFTGPDVRLLTSGQDSVTGQATIEVSHEALFRAWPRLRRWAREYQPLVVWRSRIEPFLQRWLEHGKVEQKDYLLPADMLAEAEQWIKEYGGVLGSEVVDFITTSREQAEAERQARERARRRIIWGLATGLLVVALLALFAWGQRQTAVAEAQMRATAQAQAEAGQQAALDAQATADIRQQEAEKQRGIALARQLTTQSRVALDNTGAGLVRSGLLAIEAAQRLPSLESDQALRRVLALLLPPPVVRITQDAFTSSVAFSPDGHYLATTNENGDAQVWEIESGHEVTRISGVNRLVFSPDSHYMAVANQDHTVQIWGIESGQEIIRLIQESAIRIVIFSPDGHYLATASNDSGVVHVWDVESGQEVSRMMHDAGINDMVFDLTGHYLATASDDNTARIWEIPSGQEVSRMEHDYWVSAVDFSPDSRYLATASWDHTARVWEIASGREITRIEHGDIVTSVAFSPDGRYVASASGTFLEGADNTVRLWKVSSGQVVARMVHEGPIESIAFSPDSRYLATASDDFTARIWDIPNGGEIARIPYDSAVIDIDFSSDGQFLATASLANTTDVWNVRNDRVIHMKYEGATPVMIFSPDGRYLAGTSDNGAIQVWNVASKQEVFSMKHDTGVNSLVFSSDSHYLATVSSDDTVQIWDVGTGQDISHMQHDHWVNALDFSPDSRYIATVSGYQVRVWDVETGQEMAHMQHDDVVNAVDFSPDNRYLATASDDHNVRVWDVRGEQEIVRLAHDDPAVNVAFSPDGHYLVTASGGRNYLKTEPKNNITRIWDVGTWREVACCMQHENIVETMLFSPDSRYLVTTYGTSVVAGSRTVYVWAVPSGRNIINLEHDASVSAITFIPDSHYLVTGSRDDTARVWDIDNGQEVVRIMHKGDVVAVATSPDNHYLLTASWDNTIQESLWQLNDLIADVCERLPRNLTYQEWQYYVGSNTYHRTCPNLPSPPDLPSDERRP